MQPELEPVRVDAIQIVATQPLVPHEPKVLVQPERSLVRNLSLEHHLRDSDWSTWFDVSQCLSLAQGLGVYRMYPLPLPVY